MVKMLVLLLLFAAPVAPSSNYVPPETDPETVEREAIWNSPDMLAAREWLSTYFAASKQYSPRDAQRYLNQLHKLSAPQMREWLGDFYQRRGIKLAEHQQGSAANSVASANQLLGLVAQGTGSSAEGAGGGGHAYYPGRKSPQRTRFRRGATWVQPYNAVARESSMEGLKPNATGLAPSRREAMHLYYLSFEEQFRQRGLPVPEDPDVLERGPGPAAAAASSIPVLSSGPVMTPDPPQQ
jgi:hypothetical protein